MPRNTPTLTLAEAEAILASEDMLVGRGPLKVTCSPNIPLE